MNTEVPPTTSVTERLLEVLSAQSLQTARIVAVTIPAPLCKPGYAFAELPEEPGYYFTSGDRGGDIGLGTAASLEDQDLSNLETLEADAQDLLDRRIEVGIDTNARPPRFYGGLAYDRAPNPDGPWRHFARVRFDLARLRYVTDGERASLTLHVLPNEIATAAQRSYWAERTRSLLLRLAQSPVRSADPTIRRRQDRPGAEQWKSSVEKALAAMRAHELTKVVLAREALLELDHAPHVGQLLDNLSRVAPETTRFAFRRASSVFLGATPERLVSRMGSELSTEAVAGSIGSLATDAAVQLLQNSKELHEHQLVVDELTKKLEAIGAKPEYPSRPSIRQLRHVLHLATGIRARLFGPPHVLSLVSYLHPTPAVGGVPEDAALEFVRRHEGFERGWFAAPIGWFDALGDGQFVVGLRSGLLEGDRLRLYAGAGIVQDSEPEKELQETELKLQHFLDALGPSVPASLAGSQSLQSETPDFP